MTRNDYLVRIVPLSSVENMFQDTAGGLKPQTYICCFFTMLTTSIKRNNTLIMTSNKMKHETS